MIREALNSIGPALGGFLLGVAVSLIIMLALRAIERQSEHDLTENQTGDPL